MSSELLDCIRAVWAEIESALEAKKARLYEEIKKYPTPITACDQQFNYLLEQLAEIASELGRMHSAMHTGLGVNGVSSIDAFIRSSPHLDEGTLARIRVCLKGAPLD